MINKNISKNSFSRARLLFVAVATMLMFATMALYPLISSAAPNSEFSQEIQEGALVTDIRDDNGDPVANPSVDFDLIQTPFACLTGGSAPGATLGTNTERLYVDNPSAANDGWELKIGATVPAATWVGANTSEEYDYRDAGGGGCTDSNANGVGGQLTIDPTGNTLDGSQPASQIVEDCPTGITCTDPSGVITPASAGVQSFDGSSAELDLFSASDASDDVGRWYMTGVYMRQTIPAGQVADTYTLDMTLSVYAN